MKLHIKNNRTKLNQRQRHYGMDLKFNGEDFKVNTVQQAAMTQNLTMNDKLNKRTKIEPREEGTHT